MLSTRALIFWLAACVAQTWAASYKVTVVTGGRRYAGTDADVFINIVGEQGETGKIVLGKSKENDQLFEMGKTDVFTVTGGAVGRIKKIVVGHNNKRRSAAWYVKSVKVEVATCSTTFKVNRWLYTSRLQVQVKPSVEKGNCDNFAFSVPTAKSSYKLLIKTSNRRYSGTDANVYVNIVGNLAQTGKIVLGASKTNKDAFEQGKVDVFTIEGPEVGQIEKIIIGHDNGGRSAAWRLDSLKVSVGGCTTSFDIFKWLYTARLEVDAFPTLESGNCKQVNAYSNTPARSKGSICTRDFRKIGCFRRDLKKLPDLLITDLDESHRSTGKFTQHMNWVDYALGLHSLACRCRAKAASQGYKYFGIGFYGECMGSKDHASLEKMFAGSSGDASGCVNGKFGMCVKEHEEECGGMEDFDFFYEILPQVMH